VKRTALVRRTPLRGTGTYLFRRTPLARAGSRVTSRHRARRTGFDRATKARILDRDLASCVIAVCCDGSPGTAQTVHHLENRGMGGAESANVVTNGVAACHLDNGWVEDFPDQARAFGWKRVRGHAPAVVYPDGRRYQLLTDGTRRPA
jgi:hypothetical protein